MARNLLKEAQAQSLLDLLIDLRVDLLHEPSLEDRLIQLVPIDNSISELQTALLNNASG